MSARQFKTLAGFGPWRRGQSLLEALEKHGVESFNRARAQDPRWLPDLRNTNLDGLDLSRANLQGVKLAGALIDGIIIDGLKLTGERAQAALQRRGAALS
jgi:hypothetical protein